MKNPFVDFRSVSTNKKEIPLERIVRLKEETLGRILRSYRGVVEEEAKDLVWLVSRSRVVKTYQSALDAIQDISYNQDDIEEFCAELDRSNDIPYMITGPAGIYASALINQSKEQKIELRLSNFKRSFHFLGYRLPTGKTLLLKGDAGDFIGAGLAGGRLVVEGAVGNWCGAGMTSGEIVVTEYTGQKTGEWMRGGEIHVDERIRSMGETPFGGRIYERGRQVYPRRPESHP